MTSVSEHGTSTAPRRAPSRPARTGLSRAVLAERAPARRPITLAGPVAALWAVGIGLLVVSMPVVLAWVTSPHASQSWGETLRAGAAAWLVANAVPLGVGPVTVSLLPLGFVAIPVLLLVHAVRWAVRTTRVSAGREEATLVAAVGVPYAAAAVLLAVLASGDGIRVSPVRAGVTAGLLAVLVVAGVLLAETDLAERIADRLPVDGPGVLRAALAAGGALIAAGAVLVAVGLVVSFDTANALTRTLTEGAGLAAGPSLLLLGLGYAPVAAVWGMAYLLGPGVDLGSVVAGPGTVSGPVDLPAFPLLAALPEASPAWTWTLLLVPLLAGVLAGVVLARAASPGDFSAGRTLARAGATGAVTGVLVAAAAALADGGLGTGRMAHLGPAPLVCAVAAFGLVTVGALGGQLLPHRRPAPA